MTRTLAALAAATALAACAAHTTSPPARAYVTAVVAGGERVAPRVRAALAGGVPGLPVDVRLASLPTRAAAETPDDDDASRRIAAAHRDYVYGDFARCTAGLGDAAWTTALLAQGRRDAAARVIFWRGACRAGADDPDGARREAEAFAALGFDVPVDAATSVSPSVEDVFARALGEASAAPRVPLRVAGAGGARLAVAIDGRAPACATPCVVELPRGEHVLAVSADGVVPEARVVRVAPGGPDVLFAPSPAPPALAATQWLARYATGAALDGEASLRLLGTAVRAQQLVFVLADGPPAAVRLRAALAVDGAVRARAERTLATEAETAERTRAMLRELLVRGRVVAAEPPLTARPVFWLAVGGTALVTAAVVVAVLYPRPVDLVLRWASP